VQAKGNDTALARRMEQCLVFCRTNFDCDNLERFLNALGGTLSPLTA
jgi:superfamily II DNA/RNA helicase